MAMIKKGIAFEHGVVDVIEGSDASCERCQSPIDLMTSTSGQVKCQKCGHENGVSDMETK